MEANIRKRNLVASDHRPTRYDSVLKCCLKWRSRSPDDTRSLETQVVFLISSISFPLTTWKYYLVRQDNALVYKVPVDDLNKTLLPIFCTGRYFDFWNFNNRHWILSWAIWILKTRHWTISWILVILTIGLWILSWTIWIVRTLHWILPRIILIFNIRQWNLPWTIWILKTRHWTLSRAIWVFKTRQWILAPSHLNPVHRLTVGI